jgi:DNA-binding CsgD family transcriptional regulator
MVDRQSLRPMERRVLRLADEGVEEAEIARRFHRTPAFVERMMGYTEVPRGVGANAAHAHDGGGLRPLERCILKLRANGSNHADIARRFHRSAGHVERVEEWAKYKLRTH